MPLTIDFSSESVVRPSSMDSWNSGMFSIPRDVCLSGRARGGLAQQAGHIGLEIDHVETGLAHVGTQESTRFSDPPMRLKPPSNSSKNLLSSGHSGTMKGNDQSVRMTDPMPPGFVTLSISLSARTGSDRCSMTALEKTMSNSPSLEGQVVDVCDLVLQVLQSAVGCELVRLVNHRRFDVDADDPARRYELRETECQWARPTAAVEHALTLRQVRHQEVGDLHCVAVRVAALHVGGVVSVERPAAELRYLWYVFVHCRCAPIAVFSYI